MSKKEKEIDYLRCNQNEKDLYSLTMDLIATNSLEIKIEIYEIRKSGQELNI